MAKLFGSIRRTRGFQKIKNSTFYWLKAIEYYSKNNLLIKEERPIYIFNHVPKCGGTSLNKLFQKWFCVIKDYPPHDLKFPNFEEQQKELQKFIDSKPDYLKIKPWEIISGHYHLPELEISIRFPGAFRKKNVHVIAFIRDPLEHRLSQYYYGIKRGHSFMKGVELEDFLLNFQKNFIAQSLGCNPENYKEKIDQYFFIGDIDNYNESILALSKLLNKKMPTRVPHINRTKKILISSQLEIDLVTKFKELNEFEYLVYDYAKKKSIVFISEAHK